LARLHTIQFGQVRADHLEISPRAKLLGEEPRSLSVAVRWLRPKLNETERRDADVPITREVS
jgi:hypothetical protein